MNKKKQEAWTVRIDRKLPPERETIEMYRSLVAALYGLFCMVGAAVLALVSTTTGPRPSLVAPVGLLIMVTVVGAMILGLVTYSRAAVSLNRQINRAIAAAAKD